MDKLEHRQEVIKDYLQNADKYIKDTSSSLSPMENYLLDILFVTEAKIIDLENEICALDKIMQNE